MTRTARLYELLGGLATHMETGHNWEQQTQL